jgi:asparagine synthase (glutamine-hydrolysing)
VVTARAVMDYGSIEGTEDCLFQGLRRLCGGHCLTVEASGQVHVERWWNTIEHVRAVSDEGDPVQAFRELFFDACRIRMRSDVPLATALSGGLDSSAVHAVIASLGRRSGAREDRRAPDWQTAFIAGFPDSPYDERTYAHSVIEKVGTRGYVYEIDPLAAVEFADQIFFDAEDVYDILTGPWLIYREMRRNGFSVSLDGHGGDELLAGYHHYYQYALSSREPPLPVSELQATLEPMLVPAVHARPIPSPYPDKRTFLQVAPNAAVYRNAAAPGELAGWDIMRRTMYEDFHTRVLPSILRNFDRTSMAHGVEIRAPFMDWRLVCFCFGLPIRNKVRDGYSKAILRQAIGDLLPDQVTKRKSKMGFVSPIEEWLAGPLLGYMMDCVNSRSFLESPIWHGGNVRTVLERAARRNEPHLLRWGWEFINAARVQATFRERRPRLGEPDMVAAPVSG